MPDDGDGFQVELYLQSTIFWNNFIGLMFVITHVFVENMDRFMPFPRL